VGVALSGPAPGPTIDLHLLRFTPLRLVFLDAARAGLCPGALRPWGQARSFAGRLGGRADGWFRRVGEMEQASPDHTPSSQARRRLCARAND